MRYRFDSPNLTGHAYPDGLRIVKRSAWEGREPDDGLLWPGDEVESADPIDSPIWTALDLEPSAPPVPAAVPAPAPAPPPAPEAAAPPKPQSAPAAAPPKE